MSKNIQELATEMSKEEFLKYTADEGICPTDIGLAAAGNCDNSDETVCARCMEIAVEFINFKQPIAVMEQYLPVLQQLQQAELEYKAIDEKRKKFKEQLLEVMEANGITKWENEAFSIAYVPEGKPSVTVDSAKLKKTYPEVYEDCSKPKAGVKAYVKFNVKK